MDFYDKVLTVFTIDKANEGEYGYFGDTPSEILKAIESNELHKLVEVRKPREVNGRCLFAFKREDGVPFGFFCPAPYHLAQQKWVEENNLDVGDEITITREWSKGERGFQHGMNPPLSIGLSCTVYGVAQTFIRTTEGYLPYFAIEKDGGALGASKYALPCGDRASMDKFAYEGYREQKAKADWAEMRVQEKREEKQEKPRLAPYTMVVNQDRDALVKDVNKRIADGWKPLGGVSTFRDMGEQWFIQAIVR